MNLQISITITRIHPSEDGTVATAKAMLAGNGFDVSGEVYFDVQKAPEYTKEQNLWQLPDGTQVAETQTLTFEAIQVPTA